MIKYLIQDFDVIISGSLNSLDGDTHAIVNLLLVVCIRMCSDESREQNLKVWEAIHTELFKMIVNNKFFHL